MAHESITLGIITSQLIYFTFMNEHDVTSFINCRTSLWQISRGGGGPPGGTAPGQPWRQWGPWCTVTGVFATRSQWVASGILPSSADKQRSWLPMEGSWKIYAPNGRSSILASYASSCSVLAGPSRQRSPVTPGTPHGYQDSGDLRPSRHELEATGNLAAVVIPSLG